MTNHKLGYLLLLPTLVLGLFIYNASSGSVLSAASHLVISEIQTGITGDPTNEFVELYNPTDNSIDISGWSIAKKTAAASPVPENHTLLATIPDSTEIAPHGYYLIAHTDYNGAVAEDTTYSEENFSNSNTIYLKNGGGEVIDKVGLGSGETAANDFEGAVKGNPPGSGSVERKALADSDATLMTTGAHALLGNGEDSDNNANDFINRQASDPQNSTSSVEPSLSSPSPTASPSDTPEPSATPSSSPTASPSASASATPTATPTSSPTVTPTPSPSMTPTPTPSMNPTPTPTATPTPTPTATPIPTETPIASPTSTPTPSASASATPTPTMTPLPIPSPTTIASWTIFNQTRSCILRYEQLNFGFFRINIPRISCGSV